MSARRILRRLAALALLAIALLLPYRIAVAPTLARLATLREEIQRERALLGEYEAVLAAARSQQRGGEQVRRQPSDQFLSGSSEAIRLANLQAIVSGHAERTGLRIASVRALPPRQQGEIRLLGVRIELTAGAAGAQALLYALETGTPWLVVEQAHLTAAREGRATPATGGSDGTMVDVRLDISGASARRQ